MTFGNALLMHQRIWRYIKGPLREGLLDEAPLRDFWEDLDMNSNITDSEKVHDIR